MIAETVDQDSQTEQSTFEKFATAIEHHSLHGIVDALSIITYN